jgi:D-serine dehydratase
LAGSDQKRAAVLLVVTPTQQGGRKGGIAAGLKITFAQR